MYLNFVNRILMLQLHSSRLRVLFFVKKEAILGEWGEAMCVPNEWSLDEFCSQQVYFVDME